MTSQIWLFRLDKIKNSLPLQHQWLMNSLVLKRFDLKIFDTFPQGQRLKSILKNNNNNSSLLKATIWFVWLHWKEYYIELWTYFVFQKTLTVKQRAHSLGGQSIVYLLSLAFVFILLLHFYMSHCHQHQHVKDTASKLIIIFVLFANKVTLHALSTYTHS